MTFRGTRSGAKYRNFAIALALFASMLVVFAFTFIASTTRLHADSTVNNIDTWGKLAKAISDAESESGLTTIKITNDLVASSQIVVNDENKIKIVSDSNKKIYRKKGDTNFSVFKVNGELELASNVHMTGATADAQSGSRNVIIKDGVGNEILRYNLNDLGPNSTTETLEQLFKLKLRLMGFSGSASSLYKPEEWEEVLREKLIVNPTNPHNPYKLGYKFNESNPWTVPSGLNMYARLETITGDVTILANWTPSPGTNGLPNYTITDTPSIGSGDGAINNTETPLNVKYTKVKGEAANNANLEHFEGGSITKDENNDGKRSNTWKGFFAEVASGGKLRLSGNSSMEGFNTVGDASKTPVATAPVYVEGNFELAGGFVQNNSVGYTADESKSGDPVKTTNNYLKNAPMTNTAGGVIFKGSNAKGTIASGAIRGNKADAGGIIVTDGAYVELTGVGRINKNVGFHHAGAALVEHGGTLEMTGGEMFKNITWARGGAVWATEWGTNGYANADWSVWPKDFPIILNPKVKGSDGNFIMKGGEIFENIAFVRAGAINVESNGVDLQSGEIYNNSCRSLGGAIYVEGDSAEYSYALQINQGYVGDNKAISKKIYDDNESYNKKLDRILNTEGKSLVSEEVFSERTNNTGIAYTFDNDFGSVTGNGGGVWLCPVGGTSVFASEGARIGNNYCDGSSNGKKGGTDFYLSKGNGAAMFKQLAGDWENEANKEKIEGLNDSNNGTILNGELRMKNIITPIFSKYDNNSDSKGINIFGNLARDGGGIAANGTVLFGTPTDVYRYDAKIKVSKIWGIGTDPKNETVTFEVLYKDGTTVKPLGNVVLDENGNAVDQNFDLELDGNKDSQGDDGGSTTTASETDDQTIENGLKVWHGTIFIPSYITKADGTREALYKFKDPNDENRKLDPTKTKDIERIYEILESNHQTVNGAKVGTLEIDKDSWKIEIREKGNKYKVEMGDLTVKGEIKEDPVILNNPADGSQIKSFSVFFSNVTINQTVENKLKEIDIPAHKNWLDEYGMVYATKKPNGVTWAENNLQNDNGYMRFINWPESGVDRYALTLEGGKAGDPDRKYTISLEDIKPLVTGNASDMTNASNSKAFNQGTNIEDRYIEWDDNRGKAKLSLEKKKYYIIYDVNGNLVYAEPAETVDPQCNNSNGGSKEYNWPADYMVAKAKALLIQRGKTQAEANALIIRGTGGGATTNNPAAGFCQYGERVYLYIPKLVYTIDSKDETGADYKYTLSEEDINSYTKKITGNQKDGFKVANRYSKTEISATKKWIDRDGEIIMTQSFGSHEFKVDGRSVWVNWPSENTEYVRIKLEDKAAGSTWKREDIIDANAIKDYLANPNKSWDAGRGSATIKFDKETYCVVLEKTTNKVVMTIPKSEIQTVEGQTVAQVAISRAAVKSGKQESELKMEERLVYFPKVVYNIDKFSSENVLAKYVITELGVGSGSYGNGSNMRTDDYVPTYYDAAGRIINYNSSIEDADKHQEMMKAGITICNERKVNVKLTKKWKDNLVSSTTLPAGVTAKFQLMKYDENQKKFVDVAGREETLTSGSTIEWTGLAPGRYAVRESSVPNGYITDMPTDGTAEVTINQNNIGQDVFEFTATNTKLTDVQATKKWDSNTWPDGKTVKFRLKRWLQYDSFGTTMYKKDMSSSGLYISKDGSKSVQKEDATSKYYVEIGGTKYYVENEGFVIIDGMMYALKGGSNQKDREGNNEKVLVTPKDKDGNDVTQTKTATSTNRTVTWTNMPKYDYGMRVSDAVGANDSENKKVRVIRYWIEEEFIVNYSNQVSYANNDTVTQINVLNEELDGKVDVPAEKKWNDGDPASRPVIKFELWYMTETYYSNGSNWSSEVYSNNRQLAKMSGEQYEYIIDSPTKPTTKIWQNLNKAESEKGSFQHEGRTYSYRYTYYYYAPREAVKIGVDSTGKDVYVYVATTDLDKGENQIPGKIVATKNGSGYTVTVYELKSDGTYDTSKKIDEAKNVATLDERALSYIASPNYFKVAESAQGCGTHYGLKAFNTSPAIEKYVKKDVHKNLETKDEVFTYDIMAFVPAGSKEIKIYDPLVKALEFVDKSGKKQSELSEFSPSNLVDVAYMNTNNHKAVSKDPINASVVSSGTALAPNQYNVAITRNPSKGSPLGSSSDDDYATKLNNYIALENYENKLTVTIPESTLKNNDVPETGLWVKVTFKAKIRDEINFEDLKAEQREKLGLETITTNDPVDTAINTHTGFKNKASYDVKLINNYKFENVPSNEVTVIPPTSLKLEKRVTGTLGDLNKEFVFKVELTGVKHTDGDNNNNRDYYYAKDKSNVVNGAGQPKAYMDEDMDDQNHQTYKNGFNVSGTTKDLWFKLKAGQSIEIQGLPVGATYKITEVASDHRPSYKITDLGNVKEASRVITTQDVINRQLVKDGNNWIKATAAMVGTTRVVATNVRESSNGGSGQALSTADETVDPGEIAVVTYTNHRDIETETGIIKDTWPWNIILLIVLVLLAYDDQMRKIKNRLRIHRISQV